MLNCFNTVPVDFQYITEGAENQRIFQKEEEIRTKNKKSGKVSVILTKTGSEGTPLFAFYLAEEKTAARWKIA